MRQWPDIMAVELWPAICGSGSSNIMHRTSLSSRLDDITRCLLIAMGVATPVACGGQVTVQGGSGGSGGTTGSNTSSATTNVSVSSSTGGATDACLNPKPVIVQGQDVGVDVCAGGQFRRRSAESCPPSQLPDAPCCGGCPDGFFCHGGGEGCACVELCATDADCPSNELCLCTEAGGRCVPGDCQTDGDCAPGQACTSWDMTQGCGAIAFTCTTVDDSCGGDFDCEPGQTCFAESEGARSCIDGGCAIGRPFLVHGRERTAPPVARDDWRATDLELDGLSQGLDPATRNHLAEHWLRVGAMEHASVAAFARFALQLLHLGAPPELLQRTHRAMADETRHAQAAFALASAYADAPVGPGPLPIDDALHGALDVEAFVALLLEEGCIGETVAALEAAESQPTHPAVQAVLKRIAVEEAEHAELAWRTLAWVLKAHPVPARRAAEHLRARLASTGSSTCDGPLGPDGLPGEAHRAGLRARTIDGVVRPCLDALLASQPAPAPRLSV